MPPASSQLHAYEPVIGLEIHAQLLTASKIFCGCSAAFGGAPNTHVCPVCLGLPGALPVLNRTAVDYAIRAGAGARLHDSRDRRSSRARTTSIPIFPRAIRSRSTSGRWRPTAWCAARSDYWAPDYDIRIKRVHMEEDAGKLLHEGVPDADRRSYVDLNRAGVPLIEIVTEPDIHGRRRKDAAAFFSLPARTADEDWRQRRQPRRGQPAVRRQRLGAAGRTRDAGHEGGSQEPELVPLRREGARVRDRPADRPARPKAAASFRRRGSGTPTPAGRSRCAARKKRTTTATFPSPICRRSSCRRRVSMRSGPRCPSCPPARRRRFVAAYGLSMKDAVTLTQVVPGLDDYFEETVGAGADLKLAKNWLLGHVLARMNEDGIEDAAALRGRLSPAALAGLLALVANGTVSGSIAKDVFEKMFASGRTAAEIVAAEGLTQIDDESAIRPLVDQVLATHADAVAQYRAGKTTTFGFLVGQVMKAAAGEGEPEAGQRAAQRQAGRRRDRSRSTLSKVVSAAASTRCATSRSSIDKGRVHVPDRPERRRQVDAAPPAAARGSADRRRAEGRRPRPHASCAAPRSRPTAAAVGFVFQDFRLIPRFTVVSERRLRDAGARRRARRAAAEDVSGAEVGRAAAPHERVSRGALGRRAAAHRDRARAGQRSAARPGRRADRATSIPTCRSTS